MTCCHKGLSSLASHSIHYEYIMWGSWSWHFSVPCNHRTSKTCETKGKWRVIQLFIEMSLRTLFFWNMMLCYRFPMFGRNMPLCTFKTSGTNYSVTWHNIPDELAIFRYWMVIHTAISRSQCSPSNLLNHAKVQNTHPEIKPGLHEKGDGTQLLQSESDS